MIRREALKNGRVLSELVKMCKAENSLENTYGLLRCLRDASVWIPMNMKVSDTDVKKLLASKVGDTITTADDIRAKPDILVQQDTGEKVFPVFSQKEQAPADYAQHFSWLQLDFMLVCEWVHADDDLAGIMIDPFTACYFFPKKNIRTIKQLESELVVENGRDLNKFKGCLVGGAMGDALGYPVEFRSTMEQIREKYGEKGITRYDVKDGKALISDDTQMTMFTANGLLFGYTKLAQNSSMKKPEYYIWKAYKDWYTAMRREVPKQWRSWLHEVPGMVAVRGPGHTCTSALRKWDMGRIDKPLNDSKGNGGVMRVAPIGLYFDDQHKIAETCMLGATATAATHGHPLGYIAAAAMVYIINQLAYSNCVVRLAVSESMRIVQILFPHNNEDVEVLLRLLNLAIDLSEQDIDDCAAIEQIGKGGVAEEALAIAVYCSVKYQDHFEKAIIAAVNHSGDSDSTGSITGNILGAYWGYDALPESFQADLECLDTILEIAEDLYHGPAVLAKPFEEIDDAWKRKYIDCRRP